MGPDSPLSLIIERNLEARRNFYHQLFIEYQKEDGYGVFNSFRKYHDQRTMYDHFTLLKLYIDLRLGCESLSASHELPFRFTIQTKTENIPPELSNIFKHHSIYSNKSNEPEHLFYTDVEIIRILDLKEAAHNLSSSFHIMSERIKPFKKLLTSTPVYGIKLPNYFKDYILDPELLDIGAKFYNEFYQYHLGNKKPQSKSWESHTDSQSMLYLIEIFADEYLRLSDSWGHVRDYQSFFDFLLEKIDNLKKSDLLEYLKIQKENYNLPEKPAECDLEHDINDTEFVPLLLSLHKYQLDPVKEQSIKSKLIKIVTQKRLAELVAKEAVENPISYDPKSSFDLGEFIVSCGYGDDWPITEGPYWRLLLGLEYWLGYSRSSTKYDRLTELLPKELMNVKNDDEVFLTLLPNDLIKKMEYLYEGTTPAIVNSKLLSQQEKVNILLKLPGFADSEELLPRLNLGMIQLKPTGRINLEYLNKELFGLARQISPYLSKEELIEFFSQKIVELFIRERGFQNNKEQASKLMEELQTQLR